jgi:hypothetical protein
VSFCQIALALLLAKASSYLKIKVHQLFQMTQPIVAKNCFAVLQTSWDVSFLHIVKDCLVPTASVQAAWANKKYHCYHILPSNMVMLVKKTVTK